MLQRLLLRKYITLQNVSVFGVILVRIRENADQNNSKYGPFSCSVSEVT